MAWTQLHILNGDTYGGGGGYSIDVPQARGNTPAMCPDMNKWWKTVKVTRVRFSSSAPFVYKMETSGTVNALSIDKLFAIGGQTKGLIFVAGSILTPGSLPANYDFAFGALNKHFKYREIVGLGKDPQADCKNSRLIY